MTKQLLGPDQLRQRLKALLIVGSLLLPTFCAVGGVALLAAFREVSPILWVLFGIWALLGALLGALILRLMRTLEALGEQPRADTSNDDSVA